MQIYIIIFEAFNRNGYVGGIKYEILQVNRVVHCQKFNRWYYQQEIMHQMHFAPSHSPAKFHKYCLFFKDIFLVPYHIIMLYHNIKISKFLLGHLYSFGKVFLIFNIFNIFTLKSKLIFHLGLVMECFERSEK